MFCRKPRSAITRKHRFRAFIGSVHFAKRVLLAVQLHFAVLWRVLKSRSPFTKLDQYFEGARNILRQQIRSENLCTVSPGDFSCSRSNLNVGCFLCSFHFWSNWKFSYKNPYSRLLFLHITRKNQKHVIQNLTWTTEADGQLTRNPFYVGAFADEGYRGHDKQKVGSILGAHETI